MRRNSIARMFCIVALIASTLMVPLAVSLAAQKSEGTKKTPRLPNYYSRVASGQQRTQLRSVLNEYAPQIQAKREELQALIAKRDAALDEVLTPEQREQIAKLRAEAAARRKARSSAGQDGSKSKTTSGKKAA